MACDPKTKLGKFLLWEINLFSNKYNQNCDCCWHLLGQISGLLAGLILGGGAAWLLFQ